MNVEFGGDAFERLLAQYLPAAFPALSLCVIQGGRVVWQEARGYIDADARQLPVRGDTRFDLASVSKLITTTAFLALVDAGEIQLESRLVDALPEFGAIAPRAIASGQDPHTRAFLPVAARYRGMTVDPAAVTFRHLLTHSSGLPAWRSVYLEAAPAPPRAPLATDNHDEGRWRRGLAAMTRFPFAGPVGESVLYSDIGMMLLGAAVARLTCLRLDRSVESLVLQPLGLSSFTYNPVMQGVARERIAPTEFDDHWRGRRAWGEVHDENACGIGGVAGHAGLFAAAADLARFGKAWLEGDSRLPVSAKLRRLATSEQASGDWRLGLGWMLKTRADSPAGERFSELSFGHTGFTGTSLWIDPRRELVCAVLTNRVYHGRQAEGIHAFRRALHDHIAERVDHA